jgi:hypothetical protein
MRDNYLVHEMKSMERATHQRLIEQLRAELAASPAPARVAPPAFRAPAERYRSAADHERERDGLFGALRGGTWVGPPRVIAASASIAAGACVPVTVIVHPDFVSLINLYPLAPDRTDYEHLMFVPADRAGEAEHWDKSWTLIEDGVFQREDLWACEQIQRGLTAGMTDELLFGELEAAVRWFHATIDGRLGRAPLP